MGDVARDEWCLRTVTYPVSYESNVFYTYTGFVTNRLTPYSMGDVAPSVTALRDCHVSRVSYIFYTYIGLITNRHTPYSMGDMASDSK